MLASHRLTPHGHALAAPRWRGQAGRLEVWYATATDTATGTGLWVHHELVAPEVGPAYAHGWTAVFPPDRSPVVERFGPDIGHSGPARGTTDSWLDVAGTRCGPGLLTGAAGRLAWDLSWADDGRPLLTFPRWAWHRELLPAAQVVPAPTAGFAGTVTVDGVAQPFAGPGAAAHIYGHGNAQRWGWLHADLGDGDVLEVVSAVSRRPGLSSLPPLAFVQLRVDGRDWPRDPALAAPLFRTRLGLPHWSVTGVIGDRRLRVRVSQPPDRCVALDYADPDGAGAVCTNTERADAEITVERWRGLWRVEHQWSVAGTAHAEVGQRDAAAEAAVTA